MPSRRVPLPTRAEVDGGVYIDFEKNIDMPPSILGILVMADGTVILEQHVIERALHPAAVAWSPDVRSDGHCVASSPRQAIDRVGELAAGRRVFAYAANHERDLIQEIAGTLPFPIEDMKRWARRWRASQGVRFERRPFEGGPNSLRNMAELAGIEYPPFLGRRRVGPNLSRVRQQLERHDGRWDQLPRGAKLAWSRVLRKNRWDCFTSREVLLRVIDDLA